MFFQSPRVVKTKPISVTHSQQNISVTGVYFTGGFTQRSIMVHFSRDQSAAVSAQMKVDRGDLHVGSPSLVKSPLTQGLSRPPNHAQCFVLLPQLLGLVTLLRAPRQTPAVRPVPTGCIFLFICTVQCFYPQVNGSCCIIGDFPNTYPRCEGGSTQLSTAASASWQNTRWGSSLTPSHELEFLPAISSH